jgi:hypothetical protein
MSKKILSIMVLICALALVLSSCVSETVTLDLKNDGGTIVYEQVITKEVYDSLISMGGDPEEIKKQGKELSFFKKDGEEYVKVSAKQKFDSLAELNEGLKKLGDTSNESGSSMTSVSQKFFNEIYVHVDEEDKTMTFEGTIGKERDVSSYISCELIVKFPGAIKEYNIGEKENSNTLKIDMLDAWENSPNKDFEVVASLSASGVGIVAAIGVVVILVSVAFVMYKKNIDKANAATEEPTNEEEPSSEA